MQTIQEVSAGGVIVRSHKSVWEVLLMKDLTNTWTFPKGLIEEGEDPQAAAQREIAEEVGLTDVVYRSALPEITYWYVRNGNKIHKRVLYFVFEEMSQEIPVPQTEEGITEIEWFSFEKAMEIVGYPKTNRKLLEETKAYIADIH